MERAVSCFRQFMTDKRSYLSEENFIQFLFSDNSSRHNFTRNMDVWYCCATSSYFIMTVCWVWA